jgi:nicotinamidase-related amidase
MKRIILIVMALLVALPVIPQKKSALLVIDIQRFYFPGGSLPLVEPEKAAENALKAINKCRAENIPVIFIQHNSSAGMEISDIVKPVEGEAIFTKDEANSFLGTGLYDHLKKMDIDTLVICGMQTHMCVEAAVRAAHDFGFSVTLLHDACATRDLKFGDRVVSAADVHSSTLAAMKSYAGVVSTEEWIGK